MHPALRHTYYYSSLLEESYSETVTAWLAKVNALEYTAPDATFLSALDALLATSLETGTVLSRMKTGNIYGFGSIEAGTVNIKDPEVYQHTLHNSPTYLAANGVRSNVTTSYINTKYKVNEYAGIETDLTTVVYVSESTTNVVGSAHVYGARPHSGTTSTPYRLTPLLTASAGTRGGYGAVDNFSSADNKGLYILTYNGTASVLYKDYTGGAGVKDSQVLTPSAPNISNDVLLLARNSSGVDGGLTAADFFDKYTTCLFRFDRFTDTDATSFKTAWETFKTATGVA